MSSEIKVPSFGESVSEATVVQIMKNSGEYVEKDDEILELESDKVNAPVLAPESGILQLSVSVDDVVKIDQSIGSVDPSGEKPKESEKPAQQEKKEKPKAEPAKTFVSSSKEKARENEDDYLKSLSQTPPAQSAPAAPVQPSKSFVTTTKEGTTRKRMSGMRKAIAANLVKVKNETAMLTTFNEVDMSKIMKIRAKEKDSFLEKHGVKLGFMSFFVKACISALKEYPDVNSYIEGDEIVSYDNTHIGVAVSTDKGLMVPVIRDCDELTFAEIEQAVVDFAKKARDGKLSVDDMKGGSFTITNGGVFGSMLSTPILNPPQSAILGMHSIIKRPIAIDDEVVIRPMMYLAVSYDHRIIDGKEAVSFLVHIKELLEDPTRLLLDF